MLYCIGTLRELVSFLIVKMSVTVWEKVVKVMAYHLTMKLEKSLKIIWLTFAKRKRIICILVVCIRQTIMVVI